MQPSATHTYFPPMKPSLFMFHLHSFLPPHLHYQELVLVKWSPEALLHSLVSALTGVWAAGKRTPKNRGSDHHCITIQSFKKCDSVWLRTWGGSCIYGLNAADGPRSSVVALLCVCVCERFSANQNLSKLSKSTGVFQGSNVHAYMPMKLTDKALLYF